MIRRKAIKISFQSLAYAGMLGALGQHFSACAAPIDESKAFKILNPDQYELLSIIADIMIPSSDLPGAIQVGAVESIDQYMYHFLSKSNQAELFDGLDRINILSQQMYQKSLLELDKQDQLSILQFLSNDANNSANKTTHLFFLLREMVVRAYFESELVSKEVLKYDPIPTMYQGCIPIEPGNVQWSL